MMGLRATWLAAVVLMYTLDRSIDYYLGYVRGVTRSLGGRRRRWRRMTRWAMYSPRARRR